MTAGTIYVAFMAVMIVTTIGVLFGVAWMLVRHWLDHDSL